MLRLIADLHRLKQYLGKRILTLNLTGHQNNLVMIKSRGKVLFYRDKTLKSKRLVTAFSGIVCGDYPVIRINIDEHETPSFYRELIDARLKVLSRRAYQLARN